MVGHSADSERLHVVGSRDPAHVSPESRLEFFRNAGDPVSGGENAMKEQAGFCVVGHRLAILMLSRPLRDFSFISIYPALERQGARRTGLFSVAPIGAQNSNPVQCLSATHLPANGPAPRYQNDDIARMALPVPP